MSQHFEIYPECEKPHWLKKGAWTYCLGEGLEKYKVGEIGKNAAVLYNLRGECHGWESFTKLFRTEVEINEKCNRYKAA